MILNYTFYKKDLRDGRWMSSIYYALILSLVLFFSEISFLILFLLAPKIFINLIWSVKGEFDFFHQFGSETLNKVVIARKVNVVSELNVIFIIVFSIVFFLFEKPDLYESTSIFFTLNSFLLVLFLTTDLVHLLNKPSLRLEAHYLIVFVLQLIFSLVFLIVLNAFREIYNLPVVSVFLMVIFLAFQVLVHLVFYPKLYLSKYVDW